MDARIGNFIFLRERRRHFPQGRALAFGEEGSVLGKNKDLLRAKNQPRLFLNGD